MKRTAVWALAFVGTLCSTALAQTSVNYTYEFGAPGKLFDNIGQSGMTFLKIGPMAGAAGTGDTYTGLSSGAASVFYNPAGLGFLRGTFDVAVGEVNWIAGIKVASASVAVPVNIGGGPVFIAAISYVTMDYGTIYGTVRDTDVPIVQYRDVGNLSPTENALGLSLAKQFTDKFSLGLTARYVTQELPWYNTGGNAASPTVDSVSAKATVFVFDAGTQYRTGWGSSVIAMSIRNFARSQKYEVDSFRLPMTFAIGIATDVFDFVPTVQDAGHRLMVMCDATHPPDHPEQFSLGAEYSFLRMLFLRGGYHFLSDTRKLSLGAGVRGRYRGVSAGFDYAYSDFGASLGSVNYFSLNFGM